jgi:triacylglycerol lipase
LTTSLSESAKLALLALYAEDAFATAHNVPGAALDAPLADPRLSPDWTVCGVLSAQDAIRSWYQVEVLDQRVFYGWHLQGPGGHVLAIRGTGDIPEWLIDAESWPERIAHPAAGEVETGFWSVYSTLQCDGKPLSELSLTGPVTVVGHSLGAAIATYAAYDLRRAGMDASAVLIASPRPGDARFAAAFGAVVPHRAYVNVRDLVPRLPPLWLGYESVPNLTLLDGRALGVSVTGGLPGEHHVLTYVAMMDRAVFETFHPEPVDQSFLASVHF